MMFRLLFLLFVIGLCPLLISGQTRKIDSLKTVLKTQAADSNRVKTLDRLCREFIYKNADTAKIIAQEGISLARKINYKKGEARCLTSIGIIYRNAGNYDSAVPLQLNAIKIAEEIKDSKQISNGYNNMGVIYKNQGNYPRALEYYTQSRELAAKLNDLQGEATALYNSAIVHRLMKNYGKSEKLLFENLILCDKLKDDIGAAGCYIALGNNQLELKTYKKAIGYYDKAEQILQKNNAAEIGKLCIIYSNKASANFELGNYQESANNAELALALAIKSKQIEQIRDGHRNLANALNKLGRYKEAFEHHEQMFKIHDSIIKLKNSETAMELQSRFDSDKKAREIELLKKEKQIQEIEAASEHEQNVKNRIIIMVSSFALIGIIFAAILIYRALLRNRKISSQLAITNGIIEEKNRDILDSIRYAQRIQRTILPSEESASQLLPQHFVFYKPKDIVSGDYYMVEPFGDKVFVLVVDCTGHGVPGAFMSILTHNLLFHIIHELGIDEPGAILNAAARLLPERLQKQGETSGADGMDVSVVKIDFQKKTCWYAGAFNPLWRINPNSNNVDERFIEYKANKISIGMNSSNQTGFTTHEIQLETGEMIYLFSDGFSDQFGGEKGKKLMSKNFKRILSEMAHLPPAMQKQLLEEKFTEWKGRHDQVDDICVLGIRV